MNGVSAVTASFVIYAKDIRKVATFYERTLSLPIVEVEPGFVVLANNIFEIALLRMPDALATQTQLSTPPYIREETPLKFSFLVADLSHAHFEAVAAGGATKPLASAWQWRKQLHLDGHDPEGNVVQFRKIVP